MIELKAKNVQNQYKMSKFDETDETDSHSVSQRRERYGNMKVIYQNSKLLLILGPDYCCFLCAFISFLILQIITALILYRQLGNSVILYIFIGGAIIQQTLYLLLGLSDPGIAKDMPAARDQDGIGQLKYFKMCKICKVEMKPKMRHCRECNVCIRGYDHHCPWTSKCIGEGNIVKFYFFVLASIFYFVLCFVMLLMHIRQ